MIDTERDIYSKGLAVIWHDIARGTTRASFRNERFEFTCPVLEHGSPSKMMDIFSIPELRYGKVAKIDDVRKCAELNPVTNGTRSL